MKNILNLTFSSSLTNLKSLNSSFDSGTMRIAYHGENRNKSFISKEAFEKSAKTLFNCPVVCHYDRDSDTIGGHDMELVQGSEGDWKIINMTVPVGCVPESSKLFWEKVTEDDGEVHEYLCSDVLLWKRQEAYSKIKENGITAQSMEISVKEGNMVDNVYHIDDFEFTALTLIGVEPCFESAALEFSKGTFQEQFHQMMKEAKESFSVVGVKIKEGGDVNLDNKEKEFGLESEFYNNLIKVVQANVVTDKWGYESPEFCFVDYDKESSSVYAFSTQEGILYGFNYSVDGDNVSVDFDSKVRKKFAIVDYEDGAKTLISDKIFEIVDRYAMAGKEARESVQTLEEKVSNLEPLEEEVATLKEFKKQTLKEQDEKAKDEVFSRFEDIKDTQEFISLSEQANDISVQDIEEKCFAIRGRHVKVDTEPRQKIKVVTTNEGEKSEDPYGGLVEKFSTK